MQNIDIRLLASDLNSMDLAVTALRDGSGVVLNLAGRSVLTCNEAAMLIVNRLRAGTDSIEGLVSALASEFDVDEETALADAERFLNVLRAALQPDATTAIGPVGPK